MNEALTRAALLRDVRLAPIAPLTQSFSCKRFLRQVTWFEGGWADYEAYQRQVNGGQLTPHRVKFRKLATV